MLLRCALPQASAVRRTATRSSSQLASRARSQCTAIVMTSVTGMRVMIIRAREVDAWAAVKWSVADVARIAHAACRGSCHLLARRARPHPWPA